jgi:two-component system cell cycle response regulator
VTDPLTGLYNRRYLDNHLSVLFNRSMARGRPLSMLITDIDRFKQVNDTYGHDGGDEVLREFANRVRSTIRGADLACRYGGEEFVVAMPDTSPEVAAAVAERLRAAVESAPFMLKHSGETLNVTASFGIASRIGSVLTPDQLMKQADLALYEAKNTGRNRVVAAAA